MLAELRSAAVRRIFGGGMGATLADKGIDFLAEESRKAIRKEPEYLTDVRLRPGERYTVIARPPATRAERKLSKASKGLAATEERLAAPTRRQRRAARRLRSAQRRLDRRRQGTPRWRRAAAHEREAGRRFDTVMTPSKRLVRVRAERRQVDEALAASRDERFAQIASGATTTTVFD